MHIYNGRGMSDHFGKGGRMRVPELDREYLENLVSILETADTGGNSGVGEEPLTLHRRGYWFETSIAQISVVYIM